MTRKTLGAVALLAGTAVVLGCNWAPGMVTQPLSRLAVTLELATAYQPQAALHRVTLDDVDRFVVKLERYDAAASPPAYVALASDAAVTLDPHASPAETTATFSALSRGRYMVKVGAFDKDDQRIGGDPLASRTLDLSAGAVAEATMAVSLGGVRFDATATGQIPLPAAEGQFVATSAPIVIEE